MSRSFIAALLLLWSFYGVPAGVDDQQRLASTESPGLSATAALPADELPDDLASAQFAAALPTPRTSSVVERGEFEPPRRPGAAHPARGPPGNLPV